MDISDESFREQFAACFTLDVKPFMANLVADWQQVLTGMDFMPVAYLRSELDYQSAYMRCFTERNVDLSVLFYQNKKPVGIWPLSLQKKDGLWFFMTNQGPVLPPRFIHEVSDKWQKRFISDALSALRSFFQQAADKICSSWQSNILLETNELGGGHSMAA